MQGRHWASSESRLESVAARTVAPSRATVRTTPTMRTVAPCWCISSRPISLTVADGAWAGGGPNGWREWRRRRCAHAPGDDDGGSDAGPRDEIGERIDGLRFAASTNGEQDDHRDGADVDQDLGEGDELGAGREVECGHAGPARDEQEGAVNQVAQQHRRRRRSRA